MHYNFLLDAHYMTAKSDLEENKDIDFFFRGTTYAFGASTATWDAAPTLYVGLLTAAASDSAAGTEVTGGTYARQGVVASAANWAATDAAGSTAATSGGTSGTTSNNTTITFTGLPACSLVGAAIYDAVTGGAVRRYLLLTGQPISVAVGATISFAPGQLTFQEDN